MEECIFSAKNFFCFDHLSAGRPGGLVVLPSNTTKVCPSLNSIPTAMRFDIICINAKKDGNQLLKASGNVARYNLTQVDEGRKCRFFLPIQKKALAEVWREEEGPPCDPGSELLLGGSARVVRG